MRRLTHEEYLFWVKQNRPDFLVLEQYQGSNKKILHQHIPTGIQWKCSPEKFKAGCTIPQLSRVNNSPINFSHQEYQEWVSKNRPDFKVIERYVNTKTKILHQHIPTGIQWKCSPEKFKKFHNPPQLAFRSYFDHQRYLDFVEKHKIPIIPLEEYVRKTLPIKHRCKITNDVFTIAPKQVIENPKFRYKRKVHDTKTYQEWLKQNYPELIITEQYINSATKINHLLLTNGSCWYVKPNNVISGQRHPSEKYGSFSRRCIAWLEEESKKIGFKIKHGLNGGEYRVPSVGRVDGFCEETNTVYEFHGDFWHGNPQVFNPNDVNPITKKTFGELYQKTIEREQKIINSGYNLIVVWERDFIENTEF